MQEFSGRKNQCSVLREFFKTFIMNHSSLKSAEAFPQDFGVKIMDKCSK